MGCKTDVSGDEGRALPQVNTATGQTACWHEDKLLNGFCAHPQQLHMQSGRRIVSRDANVCFIALLLYFFFFFFTQFRCTQEANNKVLYIFFFYFKVRANIINFSVDQHSVSLPTELSRWRCTTGTEMAGNASYSSAYLW